MNLRFILIRNNKFIKTNLYIDELTGDERDILINGSLINKISN